MIQDGHPWRARCIAFGPVQCIVFPAGIYGTNAQPLLLENGATRLMQRH